MPTSACDNGERGGTVLGRKLNPVNYVSNGSPSEKTHRGVPLSSRPPSRIPSVLGPWGMGGLDLGHTLGATRRLPTLPLRAPQIPILLVGLPHLQNCLSVTILFGYLSNILGFLKEILPFGFLLLPPLSSYSTTLNSLTSNASPDVCSCMIGHVAV
jgi:hypothetical protein